MNIYTRNGDRGTTSLIRDKNISKSDDRIQLVGTIDELTSHLGLVKTMLKDVDTIHFLEKIQGTLITVMAGVADPYNREYKIGDDRTEELESEIDRMEGAFERPKKFILPGGNRLSAEIDVARTVARRAERALSLVSVRFGADAGTKRYMNRLADYLYVLARYEDAKAEGKTMAEKNPENTYQMPLVRSAELERMPDGEAGTASFNEAVINEVMRRMNETSRISLTSAKKLIDRLEEEAERRGSKAVFAVCGPEGNPIAVHVMDGAFLVSFDVATKKAYTAAAVRMSTMELAKLAQPGGTFFGVDKMENGKIVIFGGGIPLTVGGRIIGALGVSGGTGEEDHSLAEYGLSILPEVLQ